MDGASTTKIPALLFASRTHYKLVVNDILKADALEDWNCNTFDPNLNTVIKRHKLGDSVFVCVCRNPGDAMCDSAYGFNNFFETWIPEVSKLLIVDPSRTMHTDEHYEDCSLAKSGQELLSYLGCMDAEVNQAALDQAVNPNPPTRPRRNVIITPNNLQGLFGSMIRSVMLQAMTDDAGVVDDPSPPKKREKLDLHPEWQQLLQPTEKASHEKYACGTCLENEKTILMIPCKHVFYCDDCFREMMTSTSLKKECPLCRKNVDSIERINF
jgi:hypothetical protein